MNNPLYLFVDGGSDCVSETVSHYPPDEEAKEFWRGGDIYIYKFENDKCFRYAGNDEWEQIKEMPAGDKCPACGATNMHENGECSNPACVRY